MLGGCHLNSVHCAGISLSFHSQSLAFGVIDSGELHLRVLIFCMEMCFSSCLRSLTSAPYFPVVPLSARMKWECRLLSTVSLLSGLDMVWYGRTTCWTTTKFSSTYFVYSAVEYNKLVLEAWPRTTPTPSLSLLTTQRWLA